MEFKIKKHFKNTSIFEFFSKFEDFEGRDCGNDSKVVSMSAVSVETTHL